MYIYIYIHIYIYIYKNSGGYIFSNVIIGDKRLYIVLTTIIMNDLK